MYRENYIKSLRTELVDLVKNQLSPTALRYGYSDNSLETNIKWRPQVLLLGNYSSGKSTLINDFLGANIQATGQAPTDDSFTIITSDDSNPPDDGIRTIEERDGKFLINNPEYPFESLKKHGQRFAAHFRLKKVNSPFLKDLALIDTPGMLDSITERDRGYNYQEVIGDLAQIADLVLILFDPHKAGTVREAHTSLRDTLPARTFEDRVLFVLNRVDECSSLTDLLQVYGTLCWNLSQMTGRKDIPAIHLTYSSTAAKRYAKDSSRDTKYLSYLDNQREELKSTVLQAPRYRLDNLATFVETHSERLAHLLDSLLCYRKGLSTFRRNFFLKGFFASILTSGIVYLLITYNGLMKGMDHWIIFGSSGLAGLIVLLLWFTLLYKYFGKRFHKKSLNNIDSIVSLNSQINRDNWESIKGFVLNYLEKTQGRFSLNLIKEEYADIVQTRDEGCLEIRRALNELAAITKKESKIFPDNEKDLHFNSE